jgi:hypothetical protein
MELKTDEANSMKVFWSWQSDSPGKIGRFLVRDALQAAIEELKSRSEIDEPAREALHLDHDREGVPGSPELVRTILDKVDGAEVVVADVTLVGLVLGPRQSEGAPDKKLINSNVAIELGYALRALTDRKVLMVFNAHYGKHEELPFDLRHRGGAIVYNLAPEAEREQIEKQKKLLTARLVAALRLCLSGPHASAAPFDETPSIESRATYFRANERLAQVGIPEVDEVDFSYDTGTLCYLRLIPTTRLTRPLSLASLLQAASRVPMLTRRLGTVLTNQNVYGAVGYEPGPPVPRGRGKLNASTQLFQNGELWSIGASLIVRDRGDRPAGVRLPFVAAIILEQTYYDKLRSLITFASEYLKLEPPWQVELGLVGVQGLSVVVPPEEMRGPVRKSDIIVRRILKTSDSTAIDSLLLGFFNEFHDATGYARPDSLGGFPPARPQWPPAS